MCPFSSLQGHCSRTTHVVPFQTVPLGHWQPGIHNQFSPMPITVSHLPRKWHFSSHKGAHSVGTFGDGQGVFVVVITVVVIGVVLVVVGATVAEI